MPRPQFLDDVHAFIAADSWTTEWQYSTARPVLASRADLLVWLDLPFRITDREHIVRWAISTRHKYDRRVRTVERDFPTLTVVRLRSRSEVDQWVDRLREWVA